MNEQEIAKDIFKIEIMDEEIIFEKLEKEYFGINIFKSQVEEVLSTCFNTNSNVAYSIAIDGKWGIGKSRIIDRLDQSNRKIVVYDAWKYDNEAFKRDFLLFLSKELNYPSKKLKRDFYYTTAGIERGKHKYMKLFIAIFAILSLLLLMWDVTLLSHLVIKIISSGTLVVLVNFIFPYILVQRKVMFSEEQFFEIFERIIADYKDDELVIVIDNIDRLLHKKEVLEKIQLIKHFVEFDKTKITKKLIFLTPIYFDEVNYIDKAKSFDMIINIPSYENEELIDYSKEIINIISPNLAKYVENEPKFYEILTYTCFSTPREIIRFIISFIPNAAIYFSRDLILNNTEFYEFLIYCLSKEFFSKYFKIHDSNDELSLPEIDAKTNMEDNNRYKKLKPHMENIGYNVAIYRRFEYFSRVTEQQCINFLDGEEIYIKKQDKERLLEKVIKIANFRYTEKYALLKGMHVNNIFHEELISISNNSNSSYNSLMDLLQYFEENEINREVFQKIFSNDTTLKNGVHDHVFDTKTIAEFFRKNNLLILPFIEKNYNSLKDEEILQLMNENEEGVEKILHKILPSYTSNTISGTNELEFMEKFQKNDISEICDQYFSNRFFISKTCDISGKTVEIIDRNPYRLENYDATISEIVGRCIEKKQIVVAGKIVKEVFENINSDSVFYCTWEQEGREVGYYNPYELTSECEKLIFISSVCMFSYILLSKEGIRDSLLKIIDLSASKYKAYDFEKVIISKFGCFFEQIHIERALSVFEDKNAIHSLIGKD